MDYLYTALAAFSVGVSATYVIMHIKQIKADVAALQGTKPAAKPVVTASTTPATPAA